jgi:hypothetical protein
MNPNERKIEDISIEEMLGAIQEIMLDLAEEYASVPTEMLEFESYNDIAERETNALMARLMVKA